MRPSLLLLLLALLAILVGFLLWQGPPEERAPLDALGQELPIQESAPSTVRGEGQEDRRRTGALPGPEAATRDPLEKAEVATGRLLVHVENATTRQPLQDVEVTVYGEDEDVTATTDALGVAELEVPAGRRFLSAQPPEASGFREVSGRVQVDEGETREWTLSLTADTETRFFLRLVAAEDGRVLADQPVVPVVNGEDQKAMRTDSNGVLQYQGDGTTDALAVRASGRAPLRVAVGPGHDTLRSAYELAVPPEASLLAEVLDASNRPLAGWTVSLSCRTTWITRPLGTYRPPFTTDWQATTDSTGRVEITSLPAAVPLNLALRSEDSSPRSERVVTLTAGANRKTLQVASARTVRGRVVDPSGEPVADLDIALGKMLGAEPRSVRQMYARAVLENPPPATSDGDGRFELSEVPPGTWRIGVVAGPEEADFPWTRSAQAIEIGPGPTPTVELVVSRGLYIGGRAIDPSGEPVAGITFFTTSTDTYLDSTRTDAQGGFRLGPLPPGTHRLESSILDHSMGLRQGIDVEAGTEDLEVLVENIAADVSGVVVDPRSGRPAPGSWVSLSMRHGEDAIASRNGLDGSFTYSGLRPGVWDLRATDRSGRCAWLPGLVLGAGQKIAALQVPLTEGGELLIRVPNDAPMVDYRVRRGEDVYMVDRVGGPDIEPFVRIEVLPGSWTVDFVLNGTVVQSLPVTTRAGELVKLSASW